VKEGSKEAPQRAVGSIVVWLGLSKPLESAG